MVRYTHYSLMVFGHNRFQCELAPRRSHTCLRMLKKRVNLLLTSGIIFAEIGGLLEI